MTAQEVVDWLRDLRFLDKYIDQFQLCEISGIELADVDETLLDDFGLPKVFQKRLLNCIKQLAMNGFHHHCDFPSKVIRPEYIHMSQPFIMNDHLEKAFPFFPYALAFHDISWCQHFQTHDITFKMKTIHLACFINIVPFKDPFKNYVTTISNF